MGFKKFTKAKYPPRLWAITSFPGDGKSTFATRMYSPILPIDADHRFDEVADLVPGDVYQLSDNPADNAIPDAINKRLIENMPGTKVGTIVVDSLTAIVSPMVAQGMIDNEAGVNKNKMSGFINKAVNMRLLQDAVTRWGTDVLWIWHTQKGRDNTSAEVVTETLSKTERERIFRSLNLKLQIVRNGDKRGIKVLWSRSGRAGLTIWDESGKWTDMPELIEAAVYHSISTPDDLLYEIHRVYDLAEQPARDLLKELGFTGFPKNGDVTRRTAEMWLAVEKHMDKKG